MEKFQNKYRISSIRLQNWDYRWAGAYFITICTQNRVHYFGEIKSGQMQLSPIGIIADILWYEIKNHFINIKLDEFVVMPNHIHGVIIITNDHDNDYDNDHVMVEAGHALPLPLNKKTIGLLPNMPIGWVLILHGKPVFMTTSFVMINHLKISIITL